MHISNFNKFILYGAVISSYSLCEGEGNIYSKYFVEPVMMSSNINFMGDGDEKQAFYFYK